MNSLKTTSLLFFFFLCHMASAQEPFHKLVAETNSDLNTYFTLNAEEYWPAKKLKLTRSEIGEAKEYGDIPGNKKGYISKDAAISIFQKRIIRAIRKMIVHDSFLRTDIRRLLSPDLITVLRSDDKKLFHFSFDAQNGGTYRMRVSVMYHTDIGTGPEVFFSGEDPPEGPYSLFSIDGYSNIYTLYTTEGTKYLLEGSVRSCSQCFVKHLSLVSIGNHQFSEEFSYITESRSWENTIEYDTAAKIISVKYETDDLSPDCSCGYENAAGEEQNDDPGKLNEQPGTAEKPVRKRCECRFIFNGTRFELTKSSWEKLEQLQED